MLTEKYTLSQPALFIPPPLLFPQARSGEGTTAVLMGRDHVVPFDLDMVV